MKNVFIFSVLVCVISSLFFLGCKNDNNEFPKKVYPTEEQKYMLEDVKGELYYDEELKEWAINADLETVGDENSYRIMIPNMDNKYKQYVGQVIFSGEMVLSYYIDYGDAFGSKMFYYSISLTSISSSSDIQPRSVSGVEEQYVCGTPSPEPPVWFFTRILSNGLDYNKIYNFKVYIHVIRNSLGEGFNKEEVSAEILANLNNYYAETNLSFSLLGVEYIDSNYYDTISDKDAFKVFSVNSHSNAIDIYVYSSGRNLNGLAGRASSIPSTACLINSTYYKYPTVAHEVGHCLGLYHTHHGTAVNEYAEGGERELVNGSNSDVAGDYITDTPADPCEWLGCQYIGTGTDVNGSVYNPDPLNLMSYSGSCREKLTQKQVERIYETIKNNSSLKAACTSINKEISGPLYINDKATYSVDVPNNYHVSWKITCDTYTNRTGVSSSSYTETLIGKSITLINKNPQASSQKYTLDVTITTPRGYIMCISKKVYHVLVSANTGNLRWGSESRSGNFFGTINMETSSLNTAIKIYQGGNLFFYYSDISGGGSTMHDSYYDFQVSNTSSFTKVTGSNNTFYCKPESITMTSNLLLMISVNGLMKIVQVPVQILQRTNYAMEQQDSLRLK